MLGQKKHGHKIIPALDAGADSADLDSCRVFRSFRRDVSANFLGYTGKMMISHAMFGVPKPICNSLRSSRFAPHTSTLSVLPMFSFKASRQSRNLQVAVSPSWCAKPQWKLSRSHHFRQPMISRSGKIALIRRDPSTISIQSLNAKLALCAVAVFPQQPQRFSTHSQSSSTSGAMGSAAGRIYRSRSQAARDLVSGFLHRNQQMLEYVAHALAVC